MHQLRSPSAVTASLPARHGGRARAAVDGVAAGLRPDRARRRPATPPLRLGIVFFSNGVEPIHWWAKGSGAAMELGPGLLPMMPHREDMVFVKGLFNQTAHVSTSPHLGRMNLLSGATGQPRSERDPRRHVDGPDPRGADRQPDRDPEPRARHRAERAAARGRPVDDLRLEPVVGLADQAGDEGDLSVPRVRSPGRRRIGPRARSQHPRRRAAGLAEPAAEDQPRRQRQADRVLRIDPRHREAHRAGVEAKSGSKAGGRRSRSPTCRGRRTSCRRTSRIT